MPPSEPKSSGEAELLTYPSGALNSLSGGTTDQIVSLGKVDISSAILSGRATARLNEQSNAEFVFDWRLAGFVDYSAPLIVQRPSGSEAPTIVFYGDVGTAEVDDGVARVVAAGMEQLRESTLPAFSGANLHPTEIVYTIMRLAGLKNHQMKIEGGPEPIVEVFEIVRPVVNFAPTQVVRIGKVAIFPRGHVSRIAATVHDSELLPELYDSESIAVTYVTGVGRLHDAEQIALDRIADALSWMKVRATYSGSTWPSGEPRRFARSEARAIVRGGDLISVRGLSTGRNYLHKLTMGITSSNPDITSDTFSDGLDLPSEDALRQAARACARAADQTVEPMARVSAIWESLEYYAAGVKLPKLFSKSDIKSIRSGIPQDLSSDKRKRLDDLLASVNEPTLLMKVRERIRHDRVPLTQEEFDILVSLRRSRNDATHGRGVSEPDSGSLGRAAAIVARLLLFRQEVSTGP
jgi:hypothetical protein